MSYIPDYTGFKAVSEKISFILGAWPDGDPDKPYDKDFEIEFNPKSSKADKAVKAIEKILKKNRIEWTPDIGMEYGLLIKKPTAHALDAIFDMLPPSGVVDAMGWAMDESVDEGSDYDKYATKMYGKKWDDLDKDKQTEVVDAIEGNFPLSKIKRVKESVNEAMAYKKAQQFTKKLKDDKLLQDLIYVANKIHDKMGTNDDVQEWLKTVITYGNDHPQQWSESLDEAAPKMTHHADVGFVADLISRLGGIGRRHTGAAITKDAKKAIKALQSLKDSIKREANIPF